MFSKNYEWILIVNWNNNQLTYYYLECSNQVKPNFFLKRFFFANLLKWVKIKGGKWIYWPKIRTIRKKPYNFKAKKIKSVQFVHFGHPVHTLCLNQGYIWLKMKSKHSIILFTILFQNYINLYKQGPGCIIIKLRTIKWNLPLSRISYE